MKSALKKESLDCDACPAPFGYAQESLVEGKPQTRGFHFWIASKGFRRNPKMGRGFSTTVFWGGSTGVPLTRFCVGWVDSFTVNPTFPVDKLGCDKAATLPTQLENAGLTVLGQPSGLLDYVEAVTQPFTGLVHCDGSS
jgi:hypothetical protein